MSVSDDSQSNVVRPALISLNEFLSSRFSFEISSASDEEALRLLKAFLALDRNTAEVQFLEQEEARMRQDMQIIKMRHEQEMEAKLREIESYKTDVMQQKIQEKQAAAELRETEETLARLTKNYDEAASRAQTQEHANRRLSEEIEDLRKLVQKLEKSDKTGPKVPVKAGFGRVEEEIRSLYKDIYEVTLEKAESQAINEAILAEAVAHVKKTYNEDMEAASKESAMLRARLKEVRQ